MNYVIGFLLLSLSFTSFGQYKKVAKLPKELNECSGMFFLNDSTLILHNDSEHPTKLYQLDLTGTIQQVIPIETKLIDFEAIAKNNHVIFLADIGNNRNQRRDLKIVRYDLDTKKEQIIPIHYNEQTAFPPKQDSLYFDAESLVYQNDSLYIFTKNRTKPFDSKILIYGLDLTSSTINLVTTLSLGKGKWFTKSITDVCVYNNHFYLLTYHNLYKVDAQWNIVQKYHFGRIAQREAIAINTKGEIFIATERHRILGGGKLYKLKLR